MFFKRMEMKNVKDPIAYIEVQESTLYSKVNGILGLNKESMKRKGDDKKLWMAKEMFDMKLIGTPMFRHKEDLKVEQAKKQEELFESRKPTSNFEDLRKKTEQLVTEQVAFAVPQISVTID